MTNVYGFDSTDEVQLDKSGLPIGTYKVTALKEEPAEKDGVATGVIVTYEILEGEHKGKEGKVWYNTLHSNPTVANIAKQQLKRIADATGMPIAPATPIKGRVLTLEVVAQKKDDRYTEIKKYMPKDFAPEDLPF